MQHISWLPANSDHNMDNMGEKAGKIRRCPLCGCTEHRLVGCHNHKLKHRQGPDGRCLAKEE